MAGPDRFEEIKNEDGIPVWDIAATELCQSTGCVDEAAHPAHARRESTSTMSSQELNTNTKGPRCSKDLYAGRTIEYKSGLDTFVFPTPSPLLRSPSPRPSPALAPRSATFQHLPSELRRESPKIGLAIGSPSHAPPSWARSQISDGINGRIQQRVPPSGTLTPPETSVIGKSSQERPRAKKTSSWKLFSNIFMFRKTAKPVSAAKDTVYKMNLEVPLKSPASQVRVDGDRLMPVQPQSAGLPAASPSASRPFHSRTPSEPRVSHICDSRASVSTSFNRLLRSPCEQTIPSSSPRRAAFFRGENDLLNSPVLTSSQPTIVSRTPRLELDLPVPEMERYSVMFSHLLSPTPSNDFKPSLLERRLSRNPAAAKITPNNGALESSPQTQTSSRLTGSLSIKVDERRKTAAAPVAAFHRPRPMVRSQTESIYKTVQKLADSPRSQAGSVSYSEASLPPTPTTLNAFDEPASIHRLLEEKESSWNMLTSQPVIMNSLDVVNARVDHSIDLEQQMVQVSVARQVSISRARSQVRRTVSTKQPQTVDLIMEKNRKSEVGILDSVNFMVDPRDEDMTAAGLNKEFS